jgi:hypothetical protein
MKYVFKQIDDISGATIEFSADYLPDILEHVEMFLRGSGYIISGKLDFVDYEDEYTTPKFECAEENYEDDDVEETHEWTQTLRDDSEWPFPKERPAEGPKTEPWPGVAPSVSAQYTVTTTKDSNAN